jgi:phage replication O-like protein O
MQHAKQVINLNDHRPVVKADIENGFDRLAHELTNALAKNDAKLSGCEFQIVFALIGKTYRYHKKSDWVANIQLCQLTGMSKAHVSKTLKSLLGKNIVFKNGREIGINPTVSEWKVNQSVNNKKLTNQLTEVNQSVREVNQSVNNNQPIRPPQKKETITKETNTKDIAHKRAKPAQQLPSKFHVTDEMRAWAKAKGVTVNIDFETEQFMDYHQARGTTMKDWTKAWQTWMRNSIKFNQPRNPQNQSKPRSTPENFSEKDYGDIQVRF